MLSILFLCLIRNRINLCHFCFSFPDAWRRLLDAELGSATSKMVEAAKAAARNSHNEAYQETLRKAAKHLR